MSTKVTFGADPEFFVAKKENPSKIVPACGLFGGAKKAPIFVSPEGGYLEDGCAVEFNVTPADTLVEVRKKLDRIITAFITLNKDYVLVPNVTAIFHPKELRAHPQASVLGCDADFWAYGLRIKPQANMFKNRRFAGGHIHIGLDPWPKDLDPKMFIKAIDIFVYSNFINIFNCDYDRYQFYGLPGLYRDTSYGVEWRSPDNSWALPRATKELNTYWESGVTDIQSEIQKLVGDIDTMGGEKFGIKLNEYMNYVGTEAYCKVKNPAKFAVMASRIQESKSLWDRTVKGRGL